MATSHILGHVVVAVLAAEHPQEQRASLLPVRKQLVFTIGMCVVVDT